MYICICNYIHNVVTFPHAPLAAMLQATLLEQQQMYSNVPGPRNGHRPLSSAAAVGGGAGAAPPPVPPRTYSQRNSSMSNGRPQSYNGLPYSSKPMKKYKLSDFQFVKLLGKGSFGKVHEHEHHRTLSVCVHAWLLYLLIIIHKFDVKFMYVQSCRYAIIDSVTYNIVYTLNRQF